MFGLNGNRKYFGAAPQLVAPSLVVAVTIFAIPPGLYLKTLWLPGYTTNTISARSNMLFFDSGEGGGSGSGNDDSDSRCGSSPSENDLPTEFIPVGVINPPPENEDPAFFQVKTAADGKTLCVGPFDLTSRNIKNWSENLSINDLDDLVTRRQLKSTTALAVKSPQFETVLAQLEAGQKPSESMIKRFIPGDLQRVVAAELMQNR